MNNVRNQEFINAFGAKLRVLRSERGLSQEKLALLSELDDMQVYRIENGKVNTTISTILVLARALKVSPKELLDFEFKDE